MIELGGVTGGVEEKTSWEDHGRAGQYDRYGIVVRMVTVIEKLVWNRTFGNRAILETSVPVNGCN